MSITEYFNLLFTDYTLRAISLGTAVLGAICGMLGSFAVLRKQSLLGDAISHAALPGIAIAFLITGAKDTNILLLGALVSGLIGAFWIRGMISKTHLKSDTALGLVLSLFFGFGMLLLTYIQKQPNANQAGLDKYLFGQAATLVESDVLLMVLVTATALVVVLLFWKEFKLLLFDPDYANTLGFNTKFIDILITFFIYVSCRYILELLPPIPIVNILKSWLNLFSISAMAIGGALAWLFHQKKFRFFENRIPYILSFNVVLLAFVIYNRINFGFLNLEIYSLLFGLLIFILASSTKIQSLQENKIFYFLGKICLFI